MAHNRTKALERVLENFHANWKAGGQGPRMPSRLQITGSQWLVLSLLAREGAQPIKAIAEALHVSSSAVTQIVNELVRRGWALRRPDELDRRVAIIALSSKAKSEMAAMRAMMLKRMLAMFSVLNDREFKTYVALTDKVSASALHV